MSTTRERLQQKLKHRQQEFSQAITARIDATNALEDTAAALYNSRNYPAAIQRFDELLEKLEGIKNDTQDRTLHVQFDLTPTTRNAHSIPTANEFWFKINQYHTLQVPRS
jgi:hypothetical protein